MQRHLAVQLVALLADDVVVAVERVDRHYQELDPPRLHELPHAGDRLRVVDRMSVRNVLEQRPQVRFRRLQARQHPLPDRDAVDDDDELGQPVAAVQFERGPQVDVGLAGAGLHLDRVVREPDGLRADFGRNRFIDPFQFDTVVFLG